MGPHLTFEDRSRIEFGLHKGESFKAIARSLGKSHTTISREIRTRAVPSDKSAPFRVANRCLYRRECEVSALCKGQPNCRHKRCSLCNQCNSICPKFVEEHCAKLGKPPYVCNGCETENKCTLRKRYYLSSVAQKSYEETLVASRDGFNVTEEEISRLDAFITPLIQKGQAINHIYANNPNEFEVCLKSVYTYLNAGLFEARRIDMPRSCRLRPRKRKSMERKIDPKCRVGRTYDDYVRYINDNPDTPVVEMDTVEGVKGGKVLLTIHFCQQQFMLASIRYNNTSSSVLFIFERKPRYWCCRNGYSRGEKGR
mgnify:FL=1